MNTLSALDPRVSTFSNRSVTSWNTIKALLNKISRPRPQLGSKTIAKNHLGQTVEHKQYGKGTIVAILPDGRIQVRFKNVCKSQFLFPSCVDRL
jgi:hypothetical protein